MSAPAAETSSSWPRRRMIAGAVAAVVVVIAAVGYNYHYRGRAPGEATQPPAASSEEKAVKRPSQAITKAGDRAPSRPEACTDAMAALGLCATTPAQKKETAAVPAPQPAAPRSKSEPGKADGKQSTRAQPCTDAAAALGLCAPKPPQRKE